MEKYWIILVDDDEDDALLLEHLVLHKHRVKFNHYIDPILFLADLQAGACQADLVIVDFRLPRYSGLDIIKSIHFYCHDCLPKLVLWSGSQIIEQELKNCLELDTVFIEKGQKAHTIIAEIILEGQAN